MKNGKVPGRKDILSEMTKTEGEAGVVMISDLVNQGVEGVTTAAWDSALLSTVTREKEMLQGENYKGLTLSDYIVHKADRVIEVDKTTGEY